MAVAGQDLGRGVGVVRKGVPAWAIAEDPWAVVTQRPKLARTWGEDKGRTGLHVSARLRPRRGERGPGRVYRHGRQGKGG